MSEGLIELTSGKQHTWHASGPLQWRGYAFWQGRLVDPAALSGHLFSLRTKEDWSKWLAELNGCFALVWRSEELLVAAMDIGRTIPLFWQENESGFQLKDALWAEPLSADCPWLEQQWFAQAEFIPGSASLYTDWYALQAGQFLYHQPGNTQVQSYFTHHRPSPSTQSFEALSQQFSTILDQIIDRLITQAAGRPIVIPLSGGYDSRLILAGLHQRQYPKLQAFTYGQAESWEVKVAANIAKKLQVDWAFVPYTPALLADFFREDWWQFTAYAANGVALPQEQDYFALRELKRRGWLAEGSVICPGYCGDFQAGSYHPQGYFWVPGRGQKAFADQLVFRFLRAPTPERRQMLASCIPKLKATDEETIISEMEHWVLSEYVSKYILNGVRAYEWMDCHWYLPLWDRSFIDFWRQVPNRHRTEMQLYRRTLERKWFSPMDLLFQEDQSSFKKRWVDTVLPVRWKHVLKQWRPAAPVSNLNGLHVLIPAIQSSLNWPATDLTRPVNEMIGWWYMQQIEKSRYI